MHGIHASNPLLAGCFNVQRRVQGISGRSASRTPRFPAQRSLAIRSSSEALTEKRCEPCEPTTGSLDYMGLCMALSKQEAEAFLAQARDHRKRDAVLPFWFHTAVSLQGEVEGWELREDEKQKLHLRRQWRTKNFVKVNCLTFRSSDHLQLA